MNDLDMQQYHKWLIKRSIKGLLYRRFYLYPKIWRRISGKVLDVGCGIGDFVRLTKNAIGVDINPYNVQYCNRMGINAVRQQVDQLPFDDAVFDAVIFDNVIEHIYSPEIIISEAIRVTKIGGTLSVGIPMFQHFFHDKDHKVYYANEYMTTNFYDNSLDFVKLFYTPKNKIFQRFFVHSCRWFVYKKLR